MYIYIYIYIWGVTGAREEGAEVGAGREPLCVWVLRVHLFTGFEGLQGNLIRSMPVFLGSMSMCLGSTRVCLGRGCWAP